MTRKLILCGFLALFFCTSCSDRSTTEQMWKHDSYYYEVGKDKLSKSQLDDLINAADGVRIIQSNDRFYVRKSWVRQYSEISAKVIATPVTVSLDVAQVVVIGAITDPRALEVLLEIAVQIIAK